MLIVLLLWLLLCLSLVGVSHCNCCLLLLLLSLCLLVEIASVSALSFCCYLCCCCCNCCVPFSLFGGHVVDAIVLGCFRCNLSQSIGGSESRSFGGQEKLKHLEPGRRHAQQHVSSSPQQLPRRRRLMRVVAYTLTLS